MSSKKEIVFFHLSAELYGADRVLLNILVALKGKANLRVCLPNQGPLVDEMRKCVPEVEIIVDEDLPIIARVYMTPKGVIAFFVKYLRFRKKAHRISPGAIVYLNTMAVSPLLLMGLKNKIILHVHEILDNKKLLNRQINQIACRNADKIVCVSNAVRDNLLKTSPNCGNKMLLLYNGIEQPAISIESQHCVFENSDEKLKFVLVGRLKPMVKGQIAAIKAFSLLSEEEKDKCKLYFIGSTVKGQEYMEEEIRNEIKINGLERCCTIIPFEKNMGNIYSQVCIALVPSMRPDPLPTTVIEAMSYSLPVIGSNAGGIPEMIIDGKTGYLIDPQDSIAFRDAIRMFILNPQKIRDMGDAGREYYLKNFTFKVFQDNFDRSLASLIDLES